MAWSEDIGWDSAKQPKNPTPAALPESKWKNDLNMHTHTHTHTLSLPHLLAKTPKPASNIKVSSLPSAVVAQNLCLFHRVWPHPHTPPPPPPLQSLIKAERNNTPPILQAISPCPRLNSPTSTSPKERKFNWDSSNSSLMKQTFLRTAHSISNHTLIMNFCLSLCEQSFWGDWLGNVHF